MSEHIVADTATTRLINWILGVGSVVTGGLLLWIGATTFQLAQGQIRQTTQLENIERGLANYNSRVDRNGERLEDFNNRLRDVEREIDPPNRARPPGR